MANNPPNKHIDRDRNQHSLEALQDIPKPGDLNFPNEARKILNIGRTQFDYPIGAVSYLDGDKLRVLYASSPDNDLPEGTAIDVCDTFCDETMRSGQIHAIYDVNKFEQWRDHPGNRKLGIQSYLGAPIYVQGKAWGTVCFLAHNQRINHLRKPTKICYNSLPTEFNQE